MIGYYFYSIAKVLWSNSSFHLPSHSEWAQYPCITQLQSKRSQFFTKEISVWARDGNNEMSELSEASSPAVRHKNSLWSCISENSRCTLCHCQRGIHHKCNCHVCRGGSVIKFSRTSLIKYSLILRPFWHTRCFTRSLYRRLVSNGKKKMSIWCHSIRIPC